MCKIVIFIRPKWVVSSSEPALHRRLPSLSFSSNRAGDSPEFELCNGMAWTLRSQARWEETYEAQKRRLGKHLADIDTKLSFATFDLYLHELEETRAKRGFGRLFQPNFLNQMKEFSAAINSASQVHDVSALLWGSIQALLKIAYNFVDTVDIISTMIADLTQQLPVFEEYRSLFPAAPELEEPLRELYFYYVKFCIDAFMFLKSKRWKLLVRLAFRKLRQEFEETRTNIAKSASSFKTRVDIAKTRLGVDIHQQVVGLTEANLRRHTIVKGIPFPKNFRFQGRDNVLADLYSKLHPRSASGAIIPGQTSCAIHGIGGVGKTQVALEYNYRYRENYAYIFWVRASSSVELTTSFASFARSLMPGQAVQDQVANVHLVKDWMIQNDRWLLIFDNADDADVDLSLFWPPSSHGSIIITTQRRSLSYWTATEIHLDTFDEDRGAQLILDFVSPSPQNQTPEMIQTAKRISNELGGLPLLVSHIAGYVEGTKVPLSSILDHLVQPLELKRIWDFDSSTSTNFQYGEPMARVWRLALDSLTVEALTTLHVLSMLGPDEVDENILFGEWEDDDISFLSHNKRFQFNEIRQNLTDRHLVTASTDPDGSKLSIHRALRQYIQQRLHDEGSDRLSVFFRRAVTMVRQVFPRAHELQTPTSSTWVECEKCLPHILSLMSIFQRWTPKIAPTLEFATLLADTATNYMWDHGMTSDAISILEVGESVCDVLAHHEAINLVHADICAIAGALHEDVGLSGRAIALEKCEKALELRQQRIRMLEEKGESAVPASILQLANAWNDVGVVKLAYGEFEEALTYFTESLRLKRERTKEDDIPWHYGETYKNLALVKLYQGDVTGAERMARRSCELCCRDRPEQDASAQIARSILGTVLMNANKLDEALGVHQDVYETRKEMFGETSMHTKNSLYSIAELQRINGKLEKSESNFRLVLRQCELCWPDEAVARAKYHLALVIKARISSGKMDYSRVKEADELIQAARETRRKIAPSYGDDLAPDAELESFDFMVSLLAGKRIVAK
ncbi:hypothetical protein NM208_g7479 [Fusarium decemcellulare]|uniref:Uncharacterized protein n=1 Tax=Fusarium decemcellulare TaxID=57161 RepID=A0ACC1S906_9HYPO|nr:hypothetical protein NM208_g7479 [Fusarium decemcellulare]